MGLSILYFDYSEEWHLGVDIASENSRSNENNSYLQDDSSKISIPQKVFKSLPTPKPSGLVDLASTPLSKISRREALSIAIKMEEGALRFYRRLAKSVGEWFAASEKYSVLFEALADDEDTHVYMYRNMLAKTEDETSAEVELEISESLLSEVREIVEKEIPETLNFDEALKLALYLEAETLRFYYTLMEKLGGSYERKAVADIMKVEKKHLSEVAEILVEQAERKAS